MEHREAQENIHNLLRRRWSPRSFEPTLLTEAEIESLFQAARWAPSASNRQPWRFVYATKEQPALFEKLVSLLVKENAIWAKDAPFIMVIFSRSVSEETGKPQAGHLYDTGLAMGQLVLQATSLGLHVHQMAGFTAEKANDLLAVPMDFQPIAMAVVGHVADPNLLPEPLAQREKVKSSRKPLAELVHLGKWNKSE